MREPIAAPLETENGRPMLLAAAFLLALMTAQAAVFVEHGQRGDFAAAWLLHGVVYFAAVAAVMRHPGGWGALWIILVIAVLLRMLAMTAPLNLSTDAFRYVWDGRLGWQDISPYLHVPADESLASLRDAEIYPHINQKEHAVTIYPPAAQLIFMAGVAIGEGIGGMRAVMLICEVVTVIALIGWLHSEGLPLSRVLIYAWHPLPVWEFASQAHIDAAATAFLTLGIWAAVQRRQGLTGALFAVAALVKYFPLVLLAALWRRWDWKLPVILFAVMAALYVPYLGELGPGALGFLGQHLGNEGYRAGWGFHVIWYLRHFQIADPPGWLYAGIALAAVLALAAWAVFRRGKSEFRPERLVLLGAAFVFLTSPHYPWYFGFLCALAVRFPHPALLTMTIASVVLYLNVHNGLTWTHLYALAYVAPLAVWGVWEAGVRLSPRLRRLNDRWLRPGLKTTL
ncbi:MAG: hypothetical protein APF80_07760 [Alphaproteobacteria bacterium BRH_c36]|nr:MAG: hypothetical protein APF80_07760 [Alphaproteobacteria bacterium BRH_c36]